MKGQILIELEGDIEQKLLTMRVVRMIGMVVAKCDESRPMYEGNQMEGVRQAILRTIQDLVQETGVTPQAPSQRDGADKLAIGDAISVELRPA